MRLATFAVPSRSFALKAVAVRCFAARWWIPPVSAPPAGAGRVNRINAKEAKGAKEAKTVVDVAAFASFASFAFQALAVAVALPG